MQHAVNQTVNRVHQAMESFIHNMNTIHSRGGNQVVFSSINYGTDTSAEGRCIMREILNSTYRGVGNGETPIFPIQIWKKKRGVSYLPEDPNYDLYKLACKVTAKRFFPNFLNLDATFNQSDEWRADDPKRYEHEVATMGCRTRVFENRHGKKTSIGRGNLSFTTINIVKLGLECMEIADKEERINTFFHKLDRCIDVAADQLYDRYSFQRTAMKKQFPMLMNGMWEGSEDVAPDAQVKDLLKTGTLGIGFIGLAETLIALVGKHHGESEEAQELGLKIVKHMNERVAEIANERKQVEAFRVPLAFKIGTDLVFFQCIDQKVDIAHFFNPMAYAAFEKLKAVPCHKAGRKQFFHCRAQSPRQAVNGFGTALFQLRFAAANIVHRRIWNTAALRQPIHGHLLLFQTFHKHHDFYPPFSPIISACRYSVNAIFCHLEPKHRLLRL